MNKRLRLALVAGVLLALVIGGYSFVQISNARQEQELDKLVQTLSQAAKAGPRGAAVCARLVPAVRTRLGELEARHEGEQLWRIYRGIGDCALSAGSASDAVEFYEKVTVATPQEGRAHGDLASALSRAGRHAEAVRSAQLAVQLSPNVWLAHRILGRVLSAAGQTAEAVQSLETAKALAPAAEQEAAQRGIDALKAKLAVAAQSGVEVPATAAEPGRPLPLQDRP